MTEANAGDLEALLGTQAETYKDVCDLFVEIAEHVLEVHDADSVGLTINKRRIGFQRSAGIDPHGLSFVHDLEVSVDGGESGTVIFARHPVTAELYRCYTARNGSPASSYVSVVDEETARDLTAFLVAPHLFPQGAETLLELTEAQQAEIAHQQTEREAAQQARYNRSNGNGTGA